MAKRRRATRKTTKRVRPIPAGFHTVTPYLAINGAAKAIEWYKKAFGAKELARQEVAGGQLMHARVKIGDSNVMLSDVFPGSRHKDPLALGSSPVTLHIYTKNVDALWKRAVAAGAQVDMPLDNMFWGERYGQLRDPFGHAWSLSMIVPMSAEEMERQRREAMQMFARGQHPSAG